ncbi:hypothetical protein JCM3774_004473 [Rhodotorula dairenensis]
MPVLACGSNAFQQLQPTDQLVLAEPVDLPAGDILAASWSQTLLLTPRDGGPAALGLEVHRSAKEPVRRWLGKESFVAALLEDGRVERLADGARTGNRFALAEMDGRGEILLVPEDSPGEVHVYTCLDDLFDPSLTSPHWLRLAPAPTPERPGVPLIAGPSATRATRPGRITALAAGAAHFLILSSTKQVYSWGDSRYGQAGPFPSSPLGTSDQRQHGDVATATVNHLSFFDGLAPLAISCGGFHSAVVTRDGAAYLFGSDKLGQCGGTGGGSEPGMIELGDMTGANEALDGIEIVQVACGAHHTFVRTRDGQIWCAGDNANGQLGLGDSLSRHAFTRHTRLEERIRIGRTQLADIVCARASTYFVMHP